MTDSLLRNYALEFGKKEFHVDLDLTLEEIELLRNVLSDVQNDKVGVSLNLKLANELLNCIKS